MANKILNDLPVCTTPAPGNWLLVETPSAAQKLDVAWLSSPTGLGAALTAHVDDVTDAHDATAISFNSAGSIVANNVQAAIEELNLDHTTMMNDHEAMPMDAHPAMAISFTPTPTLTATDVQMAIEQAASGVAVGSLSAAGVTFATTAEIGSTDVQAAIVEVQAEGATALATHIGDMADAHDAAAISFAPAGGIVATDVQAALVEVASDAAATSAATIPAGSVFDYAGTAAPAGFLLMQGQAVTGADLLYPQLWAVVPAGWKSGGTLNLPDTRGRVSVGLNAADTAFDVIGETGGAKTATLAAANLPAHAHTIDHDHPQVASGLQSAYHQHSILDQNSLSWGSGNSVTSGGGPYVGSVVNTGSYGVTTNENANHSHLVDVPNFAGSSGNGPGSATPVSILQPYIVMTKMIKAH